MKQRLINIILATVTMAKYRNYIQRNERGWRTSDVARQMPGTRGVLRLARDWRSCLLQARVLLGMFCNLILYDRKDDLKLTELFY